MNFFTNFFVAAVLAGTPLLFGILGEIINEKSGHLNLGVEGMMSIGACAGFMMGYKTDNLLLALIAAFAAGMLAHHLCCAHRYLYGRPECYRIDAHYFRYRPEQLLR